MEDAERFEGGEGSTDEGTGSARSAVPGVSVPGEPDIRFKLQEHRALERPGHNFRGTGITYHDLETAIRNRVESLDRSGLVVSGIDLRDQVSIKGHLVEFKFYQQFPWDRIDVNTAFIRR